MNYVIKMLQSQHQLSGKRFVRTLTLAGLITTLAACTTYRDITPNAPISDVTRIMGQPNYLCDRPDGGKRLVWSQQPMGQYVYGAEVKADGNLKGSVHSVLTDKNFKKLNSGTWTDKDVLCEFGLPAEVETLGLGEKREQIWSYRFKENNHWNRMLHIYMGRDGHQFTHWHTGPDPLYDDYCFFGC